VGDARRSWAGVPGDPRMRRVLLAYAFGALAEFGTWLAILLVAYGLGGATLTGLASVAMLLPAVLLVPLLASVGDRIPRDRALAITYVLIMLTALATGLLLLAKAPFWVVLLGGAANTVAISLMRPMHFAALPLIARAPGDLVSANATSSLLDGLALFVGSAAAGAAVAWLGAWLALIVGAGLVAVSALLVRGLGLPVARVQDGDGGEEIRAALQGLAALRASPGALALLALLASSDVVQGSNETLSVVFNDQVLGNDASTAGILFGAAGLGLALGGGLLAGLASRRRLAPLVLAGALVVGGAQVVISQLGALWPVGAVMMLGGLGVAVITTSARTLLQRTTDDAVLARVLAVQEGVSLGGIMVGALIAPPLVAWLGPRGAFVPLGLAVCAIGVASYRALHRLEAGATVHLREVTLLSRVPFLATLPPYELERLAQSARWVTAEPGEVVVRQGEVGEAYYLVAEGELGVIVDGTRRPHTLVAGDGFGEIALLRRVPRTATVTALSRCSLLVVGSAAFLAAVTGSPQATGLADRASSERLTGDRGAARA
jgi:MFS family permease